MKPVQIFLWVLTMNFVKILIAVSLTGLIYGNGMAQTNNPDDNQKTSMNGEIRRGVYFPSDVQDHEKFHQQRMNDLIKKISPDGKPTPANINLYLSRIKSLSVYDARVICFDVKGRLSGSHIILEGRVSYPEQKEYLLRIVEAMKLGTIEDRIKTLPVANLGEAKFAICTVSNLTFYSQPTAPREHLTESILGDSLFILDEDPASGHYLVQHSTGYLGWVDGKGLTRVNLADFRQWRSGKRALFKKTFKNESTSLMIPMGAELPIDINGLILLPGNQKISVPAEYYTAFEKTTPRWALEMVKNAEELLKVPYVWGGVTQKGIDCSGFTSTLYRAYGINLSRDADEQFLAGEIVGWRGFTEDLLPGDLLYFVGGNGKITHTAVYTGNKRFMHAQDAGVHYTSFDPADPLYEAKVVANFVLAKRILRITK